MIDISIYTPVYNGGTFITRCIDSVLSQEFNGTWEWIIVDDGSTDNTVELIKSYNDDRIKVIECEHRGIVDASNTALDNCQGKYCARIDADDEMMPNRLQTQFDFMEQNKQYGITCGLSYLVDGESNIKQGLKDKEVTLPMFKLNYPITHSTVMMRSELGLRYSKKYEWAEDLEFYVRYLTEGGKIFSIGALFAKWYTHPHQICQSKRDIAHKMMKAVREDYFGKLFFFK